MNNRGDDKTSYFKLMKINSKQGAHIYCLF